MIDKPLFPDEIKDRVNNGMGCGSQIGEGWFDLVRQLDKDIAALAPDYIVDQVKEKFGGLRYYVSNLPVTESQEIYGLISVAEDKSNTICDVCGEPAETAAYDYFVTTRCKNHEPT